MQREQIGREDWKKEKERKRVRETIKQKLKKYGGGIVVKRGGRELKKKRKISSEGRN
jgi:hypothetical protein